MNSCVRSQPASSKRSSIRCTDTGRSKIMRICCSPPWEARQPGPSSGPNADSIGKLGSSDVTSTVAICSRSSQPLSDWPPCWAWCGPTILFRIISFSSQAQNDAFRFILRYQPQATAKRRCRTEAGAAAVAAGQWKLTPLHDRLSGATRSSVESHGRTAENASPPLRRIELKRA